MTVIAIPICAITEPHADKANLKGERPKLTTHINAESETHPPKNKPNIVLKLKSEINRNII